MPPIFHFNPAAPLRAIRGPLANPQSDTRCDFWADGLLVAQQDNARRSQIVAVGPANEVIAELGLAAEAIERTDALILPPFFDSHFHWVQDDVRLQPKDHLIEWLRDYTFPNEARFADRDFAEAEAARFWRRIVATGTIGGLCYSSIHGNALEAAFRHAPEDFVIGNVLMTMESPPALTQTEAVATEAVRHYAARYGARYAASPRFAPTTAPEVMRAAGQAAAAHGSFIQTHLAETTAEIAWVLDLYRARPEFATVASYTEIYDRVGLLGPKTVMGHAIHLSPAEWTRLAETDTVIASCPTSNAPHAELGLESGLFDFREAEARGVRWTLASDIGGGPYLSMLDVMRSFVEQNVRIGRTEATRVRALYRSTLAGAEVLGKGAEMGNFAPGKAFHYLLLPFAEPTRDLTAESVLASILDAWTGDRARYDDAVARTVLHGETVFSAPSNRSPEFS